MAVGVLIVRLEDGCIGIEIAEGVGGVLMIITIILPTMSLNKTSSHGTFYYKNYKRSNL